MQHNFFYAESLVHCRYNYNNRKVSLDWFQKSLCVWAGAEKIIYNAGWLMGVWGRSPHQPPEAKGSGGRAPSVWRFLQFF